jgi:NTP pyrophosphatase (non-canonical NTP hydrolase)
MSIQEVSPQRINHSDMVRTLAKPGRDIRATLNKSIVVALSAALSLDAILGRIYEERFENDDGIYENDDEAHLYHMLVGMVGETGELIDAIKKGVIYNKDIDTVNLIEELGDFEFYYEGYIQVEPDVSYYGPDIRQRLEVIYGTFGITKDQAIEGNINKLGTRYQNFKYSDQAAQERADKQQPAKSLIDTSKV